MSTRLRRTLVCACLSAIAVPAAAAGAPVEVAPPGGEGEGAFSTAARSAGCRAKSVIEFRGQHPMFQVRHVAKVRCSQVNVRINCAAKLLRRQTVISDLQSRGDNRCRVGTPFSGSDPRGTPFTQKYRYKLTLKNRRLQWSRTSNKCPKRSNDRRTLTCKASHSTLAPKRSEETIRS